MGQNALNNLIGNRDAIRRIMSMGSKMDSIAKKAREEGTLSINEGNVSYNGTHTHSDNINGEEPLFINEHVANNSKLPKQILESFRKNPGKEASTSVLGNIPDEVLEKMQTRKTITEQREAVQDSTHGNNIDYSLLKTIINEAVQENVKKYMSSLSKKLINEGVGGSSSQLMAMKVGKSFSFITENGDVYVATLKKKGNINEQKNQ